MVRSRYKYFIIYFIFSFSIIDFDTLSIEELREYISDLEKEILKAREYIKSKNQDRSIAENLFKKIGITFSVYNNFDSAERLIPFDMFPRVITKMEWMDIQDGVIQLSLIHI